MRWEIKKFEEFFSNFLYTCVPSILELEVPGNGICDKMSRTRISNWIPTFLVCRERKICMISGGFLIETLHTHYSMLRLSMKTFSTLTLVIWIWLGGSAQTFSKKPTKKFTKIGHKKISHRILRNKMGAKTIRVIQTQILKAPSMSYQKVRWRRVLLCTCVIISKPSVQSVYTTRIF